MRVAAPPRSRDPILLVHDPLPEARALARLLARSVGLEVRESGTLEELHAHLRGLRLCCVVLEPSDADGRLDPTAARAVRQADEEVPVIFWTHLSATAVAGLLREVGGTWLRKGCGRRRLTARIDRALESSRPRVSERASPASEPERIRPFQPEPRF